MERKVNYYPSADPSAYGLDSVLYQIMGCRGDVIATGILYVYIYRPTPEDFFACANATVTLRVQGLDRVTYT